MSRPALQHGPVAIRGREQERQAAPRVPLKLLPQVGVVLGLLGVPGLHGGQAHRLAEDFLHGLRVQSPVGPLLRGGVEPGEVLHGHAVHRLRERPERVDGEVDAVGCGGRGTGIKVKETGGGSGRKRR